MKATLEVWRRFNRLSSGERSIVLEAAAGLAGTWLGLRLAGFRRWKKLLVRHLPSAVPTKDVDRLEATTSARRISRLEMAVARSLPLRTNCLEQSLVLRWLLQRRGIAAELRLGARKNADRFEAHAWVEWEGEVLGDMGKEHLHFVPLDGSVASLETQ